MHVTCVMCTGLTLSTYMYVVQSTQSSLIHHHVQLNLYDWKIIIVRLYRYS